MFHKPPGWVLVPSGGCERRAGLSGEFRNQESNWAPVTGSSPPIPAAGRQRDASRVSACAGEKRRFRVDLLPVCGFDGVRSSILSLRSATSPFRMNPFVISIPRWVEEPQFPRLLALLNTGDGRSAIEIDIAAVKFLTPAAIVAMLARCNRWKQEGKGLFLGGVESCEALGYLQRIDFLLHLGIEIPEKFTRRATSDRFVPVQTLNFASGDVNQIASEITRCTLPGAHPEDDVYRLLQYAAGELLSNAKYHSGGRAYVCAQFFQSRNLVRIAVADDGVGIRGSFVNTSRENEANTPDAAIRLALQPHVSSPLLRPRLNPYAAQNHRGVGLTITRILANGAGGRLSIASESGWFDELHGTEQQRPRTAILFPGTLVAVSLHRDQIADYAAMHAEAMAQIGMGSFDTPEIFVE